MIVVVGSPGARSGPRGIEAAGLAVGVARAVAEGGASVQVVGRVGEDPTADAVLLDLAAHGVGHVAVLRTGGAATPIVPETADDGADDGPPGVVATADESDDATALPAGGGLALDAADVELALRYLPDYRVLVAVPGLDPKAMGTVVDAAGWSGARLIVIVDAASTPPEVPPDATVLQRPADADVEAFASVVARYAVELDGGGEPGAAFAAAATRSGWSSVTE